MRKRNVTSFGPRKFSNSVTRSHTDRSIFSAQKFARHARALHLRAFVHGYVPVVGVIQSKFALIQGTVKGFYFIDPKLKFASPFVSVARKGDLGYRSMEQVDDLWVCPKKGFQNFSEKYARNSSLIHPRKKKRVIALLFTHSSRYTVGSCCSRSTLRGNRFRLNPAASWRHRPSPNCRLKQGVNLEHERNARETHFSYRCSLCLPIRPCIRSGFLCERGVLHRRTKHRRLGRS